MATPMQRKAVDEMVVNGGKAQPAMRKAKYSEATLKTPKKLTESKGYKEICEEYGLTDELLLTSLVEDIKEKKGNRKGEVELGLKVKGRLKEEDKGDTNVQINVVNYYESDTSTTSI